MSTPRTQPVGAPSWFELGTTDPSAAVRFYGELLGWHAVNTPLPDGSVYTIFVQDGCEVGACFGLMPEQLAQGVRPHWGVYFRVEDVDAVVARALAAGGGVIVEPFDVMQHLRMAVLTDPAGAVFSLAQPREHPGVGLFGGRHSVTWVELATPDVAAVEPFYAGLLGWSCSDHPGAPTVYRKYAIDGVDYGGLLQMTPEWGEIPPHWAIYLRVDDVDAILARAVELGGSICVPAFDAPGVGRIGMFGDPTGAMAYVISFAA